MSIETTLDLLGGARSLGKAIKAETQLLELVDAGLPRRALSSFQANTTLSASEVAMVLGVSQRTLERAMAKPKLKDDLSDRLYQRARIIALAEEVFEDRGQALEWLKNKQYGLGHRVPLELLKSETGARMVEEELLRIEHGFLA